MKHILIVDDVATNLKCAAEVLKDTYEVITARSGKQALALLKKRIPDLILLDSHMPEMDGFEFMERLKEDDELKDIPVVFLIAGADKKSEIKGLKMGALDCIRVPFEPEDMCSRISRILQMTERRKVLPDMSSRDSFTDLFNRKYMENMLNETDNRDAKGIFLLLDIDNLKKVNDTFGHETGNEVLLNFVRVLNEEAGKEGTICRIGGDEFAVYIPRKYDKESLKKIIRRLIAVTEYETNGQLSKSCDFRISVSIGIAEKPEDGNCFIELYSAADKALYYVKQNGKRSFHFFHDTDKENPEDWEEKNLIKLLQLQRLIQQEGNSAEDYRIDHDRFMRICHLVSQYMQGKKQDVQLLLFAAQDAYGNEIRGERADKGIKGLEEAISRFLRKGDVASRCGNMQYLVILTNETCENGTTVAERIQEKFEELLKDDTMKLAYEMQSIDGAANR